MTLLASKTTWLWVAAFVVGGLEFVGVLPVSFGTTLLTLLGAGGIVTHSADIKAGRIG